jgi:L-Ala-D/L-Glu epimerase
LQVKAIETFLVNLPFRFAFGHSLATRADSTNVFVRVTLEDGTQGFGEGVPRDYVTGEDAETAKRNIERLYAPKLIGIETSDRAALLAVLRDTFEELQLDKQSRGASWCSLELAILDAACKAQQKRVVDWFGPVTSASIRYGGVIPFGGKKAVMGMLLFYKLYGFKTVKVKVGKSIEEDEQIVALARKIMGNDATIRVDANCAWTVDQTLKAAETFRKYRVDSYEQPVAASDLEGLKKITASLQEQVLVDESLCTVEQAKQFAEEKVCSAFNVRISKVGGWLAAQQMVDIAEATRIKVHLGAQVGESGILSAAARSFAMVNKPFENYEGSMNAFLLKSDITKENLTVAPGGFGSLGYSRRQQGGFGFSLAEDILDSWTTRPSTSITEVQASA